MKKLIATALVAFSIGYAVGPTQAAAGSVDQIVLELQQIRIAIQDISRSSCR